MIKKIFLALIVTLLVTASGHAQWFSIPPQPVTIDTTAIRGYRVYSVLATQVENEAPTSVTVLENTLGVVPVWSYAQSGVYFLSFPAPWDGTLVFMQKDHVLYDNITLGDNFSIYGDEENDSTYTVSVMPGMDGLLNNTYLEFRLYKNH